MHLSKIVGDFWDRANLCMIPRTLDETLQKYREAINYNLMVCPVCGVKFIKDVDGKFFNTTVHHISRIPPITTIVHKECHRELNRNRDKNMEPKFTRFEVNIAQDVVKYLIDRKFKEFNGSHWVRYR